MTVILIYCTISIVRVPILRGSISSELMRFLVTVASMLDATFGWSAHLCAHLRVFQAIAYCILSSSPLLCVLFCIVMWFQYLCILIRQPNNDYCKEEKTVEVFGNSRQPRPRSPRTIEFYSNCITCEPHNCFDLNIYVYIYIYIYIYCRAGQLKPTGGPHNS
jgi:hypothetical protein